MQISLSALRRLRVSPNATATALYLLDNAAASGRVHARTADIAVDLDLSTATVKRAVAELLQAGFMTREVRGLYHICLPALIDPVSEEGSSVSHEGSPVSQKGYVRTTTSHKTVTETANAVSAAPSAAVARGISMRTYDDGDEIGGIGRLEPKAEPEKRQKAGRRGAAKVPTLHRSVAREQWDMAFVVKEFSHRLFLLQRATGRTLVGDQVGTLLMALKDWGKAYALTPQEAASLCDQFFDDPAQTSHLRSDLPAYRAFLHYVKMNVDSLRGNVVTDEFREYVMNQELL